MKVDIGVLLMVLCAACDCGDDGPGSSMDARVGAEDSAADVRTDVTLRDFGMIDDPCTNENNRKIFVLTTDLGGSGTSYLFRFDPEDTSYTNIGEVRCELDGSFLRSMAVDRNGNAWATDPRGYLYRISTETAACERTDFANEQEGVRSFGMAFASIEETTTDRLYITATGSWWMGNDDPYRKLGVIDTAAGTVELLADLEAPTPANMELTGTGDGRLFGMVVDVRDLRNVITTVEALDPVTGATMASRTVPVEAQGGFAFAQWGGDFWLFTANDENLARVIQFRFDEGEVIDTTDTDLGVPGTIIGAGVSVCAPYNLI